MIEKVYVPGFIILLSVVCLAAIALAQPSWERTYGGPDEDFAYSVQQTSEGGYVVLGFTQSYGAGREDVYLIKTTASGDTLWTRTHGGSANDEGRSVQQTADGGYVVSGYTESYGAGSGDVYLIRTNTSGDTLWTRTYGGSYGLDVGQSVRQTTDGGYVIAGYTNSFSLYNDVYLIKASASGDTLWTRTYGGNADDLGNSVQQTSDGGYIVAGYTNSFGAGSYDVWLIKTDAQGDTLWTRTYGGPGYDQGNAVVQTTDGGYIITGYTRSFGAGYRDAYLIKTDAQGDTLWTRTYGGMYPDAAVSVHRTTAGGYVIAGYTYSFGAGAPDSGNVYLVRTNSSGETLWTRTYGGTAGSAGSSAQQTVDGGYVVAGVIESYGVCDVYLIKTDSLGNVAVEEPPTPQLANSRTFRVQPNPFSSLAAVPGHESEHFILSDISGRKVGVCNGNRIGEGLPPGVYFLSPVKSVIPRTRLLRIVKGG